MKVLGWTTHSSHGEMNISNSEQMTVESRYERQENAGVEV